jgi:hypothetical protein
MPAKRDGPPSLKEAFCEGSVGTDEARSAFGGTGVLSFWRRGWGWLAAHTSRPIE